MSMLDQYEEAQGITVEMIREWLKRNSFAMDETGRWWRNTAREGSGMFEDEDITEIPGLVLREIAVDRKISAQELLRQINPRLRKGKPSPEARHAHSKHGGVWIATHGELGSGGSIVFVSWDEDESRIVFWDGEEWSYPDTELSETLDDWSFWPCDAAGNKLKWPEDANRNPL